MESLAACHDTESTQVMDFMVNTAFVNYLNNLINSLKFPLLMKQTTHEQALSNSLHSFNFDPDLLKSLKTFKDFVHQFQYKNRIFEL